MVIALQIFSVTLSVCRQGAFRACAPGGHTRISAEPCSLLHTLWPMLCVNSDTCATGAFRHAAVCHIQLPTRAAGSR